MAVQILSLLKNLAERSFPFSPTPANVMTVLHWLIRWKVVLVQICPLVANHSPTVAGDSSLFSLSLCCIIRSVDPRRKVMAVQILSISGQLLLRTKPSNHIPLHRNHTLVNVMTILHWPIKGKVMLIQSLSISGQLLLKNCAQ